MHKQLGPVHLDIQEKTNVTFAESSLFMTSMNMAFIIGCLVTPVVNKRIQGFLMLCIICLGCSVSAILLPWSFSLASAIVVYGLFGLSFGTLGSCKYIYFLSIIGL